MKEKEEYENVEKKKKKKKNKKRKKKKKKDDRDGSLNTTGGRWRQEIEWNRVIKKRR